MRRLILTALLFSFVVSATSQDPVAINKILDEGIHSFFAGNNEVAHEKFTTAYKIDSQNFYSIFYLGWSKLERKEYGESLRLINKAIYVANPGTNEEFSYYVRGLINYRLGRYPESVMDLNHVNAIKPYDVTYLLLLARSLVANHEYKKVIPVASQVLDLDSSQADGYYYRGVAYAALGKRQAAFADFRKNLSFKNRDMKSLYRIGELYMDLPDYRQAAASYDEYLSQRQDSSLIDSALLQSGISHHFAGNQQLAKDRLNTLLGKNPQSPLAYVYLGSVSAALKDTAKAKDYYTKALSFKPQSSVVLHIVGILELNMGNKLKARELFKQASTAAQRDKDADALYSLSKIYNILNDTAASLEMIEKSLFITPNKVLPRLLRVTLLTGKPEHEEQVFNDLDRLISRSSTSDKEKAWFLANKAMAASALNRYSDAVRYLDEAITMHAFSEYYALRAYFKTIRYRDMQAANKIIRDEVEYDINKALETDHRKNETLELKAMILVVFDRYKEACELIASVPQSPLNQLCSNGEKQPGKWEIRYRLSPYEKLAPDF